MKCKTNAEVCHSPVQSVAFFGRLHGRVAIVGTNSVLMFALAAAVSVTGVQVVSAQTETVLYTFMGGSDGRYPYNDRLLRDTKGTLYGTTEAGGGSGCFGGFGCGTVFKLAQDGEETIIHRFPGGMNGANPYAGLTQDKEDNLYGTTSEGGGSGCKSPQGSHAPVTPSEGGPGCGILFKLTATGLEKVLHRFTAGNDGADPGGGSLVWDEDGNLYGTTIAGGPFSSSCPLGCGTAFELTSSGTEKILHYFGITPGDGWEPFEGLVRDADGNLYGTTFYGGAHGPGAVFELTPSGKEKVLYSFCPKLGCAGDGQNPYAGMVRDTLGNFYGTTSNGGDHGAGSVFELTESGKEKVLYSFTGGADGGNPSAGLLRDENGNLYGTTEQGGNSGCGGSGCGTVFEVTSSGEEETLYRFTGGADGGNPFSGLVRDADGNLYGTTTYGGDLSCYNGYYYGCGVVFKVRP